jgi:hypothetical protein
MTEKPDAPSTPGGDGGSTPPGGNGGATPPGGNGGGTPGNGGEPPTNGGGMEPHPQLDWVEAQRQMLRGMDQPSKTAYFQMESSQQDAMVQDWHQQNFGMPTSTNMPHT